MPGAPSTPLARAQERVGAVLKGKWHLDAVIGVGGMASVFAATHRNGSRVAVKVLNPEYAAQPEFVARFMREGYVANKINHPSSVKVIDDDNDDGCAFLVMELLSGHSLEKYTRRGGRRLPLLEVLRVSDQVLGLLEAAHSIGILHRDIKPANIHVTEDGSIKVLDFGIARLAERIGDATATQTGAALGTPSYMPPEQARGRWNMVDARTDLWALGATMHALLLGERPRRADTVQEEMLLAMTAPLTSLRQTAPATPAPVVDFIERATAFEMEARWPDAVTMQQALRALAAAVDASGTAPPYGRPPTIAPGPLGAEPGSASGPRLDTARMVPPPAPLDRDPSTLQATENTASPRSGRPRGLLYVGLGACVITLAAAVGSRSMLSSTRAGASVGGADFSAASAPTNGPTGPTAAVTAEPSGPVAPPPTGAVATAAPPSGQHVIELETEAPSTASASPRPPPAPATTAAHAVPVEAHRPKAKKPADNAIFDERF